MNKDLKKREYQKEYYKKNKKRINARRKAIRDKNKEPLDWRAIVARSNCPKERRQEAIRKVKAEAYYSKWLKSQV